MEQPSFSSTTNGKRGFQFTLRVVPIAIIGLTSLLVLKAVGIVAAGGYSFPLAQNQAFPNFSRIVMGWSPEFPVDPMTTAALGKKNESPAEAAAPPANPPATPPAAQVAANTPGADAAAPGAAPAPAVEKIEAKSSDPNTMQSGSAAAPTPIPDAATSETEQALLLRLQARREALEKREEEMRLREGLLQAAEKRLEDKIGDLKTAEDVNAEMGGVAGNLPKSEAEKALRNLVTMYETMRPKDAAKVFETLDASVQLQLARGMNPRKMSEVMAAMSPDAAAKLTAMMFGNGPKEAAVADGGMPKGSALPPGELERLPAPAADTALPAGNATTAP
jgi:flagellar motility protein MotE (MotC chaperone)